MIDAINLIYFLSYISVIHGIIIIRDANGDYIKDIKDESTCNQVQNAEWKIENNQIYSCRCKIPFSTFHAFINKDKGDKIDFGCFDAAGDTKVRNPLCTTMVTIPTNVNVLQLDRLLSGCRPSSIFKDEYKVEQVIRWTQTTFAFTFVNDRILVDDNARNCAGCLFILFFNCAGSTECVLGKVAGEVDLSMLDASTLFATVTTVTPTTTTTTPTTTTTTSTTTTTTPKTTTTTPTTTATTPTTTTTTPTTTTTTPTTTTTTPTTTTTTSTTTTTNPATTTTTSTTTTTTPTTTTTMPTTTTTTSTTIITTPTTTTTMPTTTTTTSTTTTTTPTTTTTTPTTTTTMPTTTTTTPTTTTTTPTTTTTTTTTIAAISTVLIKTTTTTSTLNTLEIKDTIAPITTTLATLDKSETTTPAKESSKDIKLPVIIGATGGGFLVILIIVIIICCRCCCRKESKNFETGNVVPETGNVVPEQSQQSVSSTSNQPKNNEYDYVARSGLNASSYKTKVVETAYQPPQSEYQSLSIKHNSTEQYGTLTKKQMKSLYAVPGDNDQPIYHETEPEYFETEASYELYDATSPTDNNDTTGQVESIYFETVSDVYASVNKNPKQKY